MKFYIGQENASGIKCDTFKEFVDCLEAMVIAREENGEEWFSIKIEDD